jgi:hypothetical protein
MQRWRDIPGAYPKKHKAKKQKQPIERRLKTKDKNCGGFELTVGRNTAIQEIMP